MTNPQALAAVVMVRPHHFTSNPETLGDNRFQRTGTNPAQMAQDALAEFDGAVGKLRKAGITVHVYDDAGHTTPDSVFPNNWFSTHAGGHIAVFPMFAKNRRKERRWDIIEDLKARYRVQDVVDLSGLEHDNLSLEGTGAMVLDHIERIAYTVKSNRADPVLLERFATYFNYEPMVFEAKDASGADVYHTNVLMTVASEYALICLDMIVDAKRRDEIVRRLESSGKSVIDLSPAQIGQFAGNALELTGHQRVLALSETAFDCLTTAQLDVISRSATPLPLSIPTIETAGGSVRCMLAGIHLSPR